ncbi:MAG: addiction module protein [Pseudomonadota bacterium]|nr:addiction module protein [Pseudomonadota bacterium]
MNTNMNLEALEAEVLKLPPADRSHLLERLISSLDADAAIDTAWKQEAEHHQADIESGKVALVSGEEAMNRLREKLKR